MLLTVPGVLPLLPCASALPGYVCRFDRVYDTLIPCAAAQIAGYCLPDLFLCWIVELLQELVRHHKKPGSTETALQSVMFPESLLDRVQGIFWQRQTLYSRDLGAVSLNGVDDAGSDAHSIEQYRAGSANPMLAA